MEIRKVKFEELQETLDLIDEFERSKSSRPTHDRLK